jgi:SnoaL-like protein
MVSHNAEVVRRSLGLNRSGDIEELASQQLPLWHPECEFTSVMAAVEPETCRGHDGLRRYLDELSSTWDEWRMEVDDIFDVSASTVVATFRSYLVGKGSGAAERVARRQSRRRYRTTSALWLPLGAKFRSATLD